MSDRELLERAAKAAGYTVDSRASFRTWREYRKLALINPQGGHTLWNAEDDDGDALRLAVKLGLVVDCSRPSAGAPYQQHAVWLDETCGNGTLTRRAIVRAAAAMANAITSPTDPAHRAESA